MTITPDVADAPVEMLGCGVGNDYGSYVPDSRKRKTPQRTLVVDPEEWEELARNAQLAGSERAVVLRSFIRWYNRRPGAKLPQRPGDV